MLFEKFLWRFSLKTRIPTLNRDPSLGEAACSWQHRSSSRSIREACTFAGPPLTEFCKRLNLRPCFVTPSIFLLQLPDAVDLPQIPLTLGFPLR
jgi:hypothetical protein